MRKASGSGDPPTEPFSPDMVRELSICSIVTSLTSGGAEVLVSNLSGEFVRMGATSTVIALCDAETVGNSAEMEDILRSRIEEQGGRFISLNLGFRRNVVAGAFRLRRILQDVQPDVIHSHTARAMVMIGLGRAGCPVVLTHHNSRLTFSPRLFAAFDRIASAYVAINEDIRKLYKRHSRRPVTLIPNAADPAFAIAEPRREASSPGRVLSVGAISEQKNYMLLLRTAAALRLIRGEAAMPEFKIAGNGADLTDLRNEAKRLGLADRVHFLGERSDIPALMKESDLYLNTSLYEGMPVTFLEAMSMALPIVATNVAGNREFVETSRNGILCPLGDPIAIARAIDRLLTDRAYYGMLSKGAFDAGKQFGLPETARRHAILYETLAKRTTIAAERPARTANS